MINRGAKVMVTDPFSEAICCFPRLIRKNKKACRQTIWAYRQPAKPNPLLPPPRIGSSHHRAARPLHHQIHGCMLLPFSAKGRGAGAALPGERERRWRVGSSQPPTTTTLMLSRMLSARAVVWKSPRHEGYYVKHPCVTLFTDFSRALGWQLNRNIDVWAWDEVTASGMELLFQLILEVLIEVLYCLEPFSNKQQKKSAARPPPNRTTDIDISQSLRVQLLFLQWLK